MQSPMQGMQPLALCMHVAAAFYALCHLSELGMLNASFVELSFKWCAQMSMNARAHTVSVSFPQLPMFPAWPQFQSPAS